MLHSTSPLIWLIPSTHGDIALETLGPKKTRLHAYELTDLEEQAMLALRERATKTPLVGEPWATETAFRPLTSAAYRTREGVVVELAAPLADVEKILAKALKPARELVRAVRFSGAPRRRGPRRAARRRPPRSARLRPAFPRA